MKPASTAELFFRVWNATHCERWSKELGAMESLPRFHAVQATRILGAWSEFMHRRFSIGSAKKLR